MSADFFGAREQEKCRAPFSGEDFFDVTRRGRLRPDATNLRTCGRHGDAAQTATLPWRGMSLYLDASVYAGLEGAYLRKPVQKTSYDKSTEWELHSVRTHEKWSRSLAI